MSDLKGRIIRLERRLPVGLEAELRAMSDKEIDARLAKLSGMTVKAVRAQTEEERERRLAELRAALSEGGN